MSDFVSRLVGRDLGPSGTVQPRVPSLFEPRRTGSGPLWPRGFPGPDTTHALQNENEVDLECDSSPKDDGLGDSRLPEQFRKAPSQRLTFVRDEPPTVESQWAHRSEPPALPSAAQARLETAVTESGSGPDPVRSFSGQRRRREAATRSNEASNKAASAASPTGAAEVPLARLSRMPSRARPDGANSATTASSASVTAVLADVTAPEPASRGAMIAPRSSDSVGSPRESRPLPSLVPATAMAARTLATPSAIPLPSAEHRYLSDFGAQQRVTDSEPAIRVTIGRVDVRAVLPTPPPRRVQPARPKPGLSLDDYLKRGNRGQR